jgi:hypothetical protein
MSAGAVFQEALRVIRRQAVPEECEADLLRVLEAGRPGPLMLLYEAGHEAGLDRETLLGRAAALYLCFCAGNLADDLADGDVDYLEEPLRFGPGAQYFLQSLCFAELAAVGLPANAIERGARTLALSSAQQQVEVRTRSWTAERYRRVGEAIAGLQWQAYLYFLWHGTHLEPRANEIGADAGFVGFVIGDLRTDDARLVGMSAGDRARVMQWMSDALLRLRAHPLRSVQAILAAARLVEGEAK